MRANVDNLMTELHVSERQAKYVARLARDVSAGDVSATDAIRKARKVVGAKHASDLRITHNGKLRIV